MPANIKLEIGGHKDQSSIRKNATNVPSALSTVLRDVLNRPTRDTLKPIFFTVRGVAFAPLNARKKQ
ncbi:hypothetical protein ES707_17234 [subsurface metagenome]